MLFQDQDLRRANKGIQRLQSLVVKPSKLRNSLINMSPDGKIDVNSVLDKFMGKQKMKKKTDGFNFDDCTTKLLE